MVRALSSAPACLFGAADAAPGQGNFRTINRAFQRRRQRHLLCIRAGIISWNRYSESAVEEPSVRTSLNVQAPMFCPGSLSSYAPSQAAQQATEQPDEPDCEAFSKEQVQVVIDQVVQQCKMQMDQRIEHMTLEIAALRQQVSLQKQMIVCLEKSDTRSERMSQSSHPYLSESTNSRNNLPKSSNDLNYESLYEVLNSSSFVKDMVDVLLDKQCTPMASSPASASCNIVSNEFQNEGLQIIRAMEVEGYCSSHVAQQWIQAGRVSVDGHIIRDPAFRLKPSMIASLDGDPMSWHRVRSSTT